MTTIDKNNLEKSQLQKFGDILQKFGLDLIQSIGEMKHTLSVLTEKIEKIEKELIDLKGIKNQLQENSRLREEFIGTSQKIEKQVRLLHSKIEQYNHFSPSTQSTNGISSDPSSSDPIEIFSHYRSQADSLTNLVDLKQMVKKMREQIYIATGGHKILFDLRTYEQILEKYPPDAIWSDIQTDFGSRIENWNQSFVNDV